VSDLTQYPPPPGRQAYCVVGVYLDNGQRYSRTLDADSPRAAEDEVMDKDGHEGGLQVCGVVTIVDGQPKTVDRYAFYLDPDQAELK
jgi:hypothetical protein